jgi:hypothetical protein
LPSSPMKPTAPKQGSGGQTQAGAVSRGTEGACRRREFSTEDLLAAQMAARQERTHHLRGLHGNPRPRPWNFSEDFLTPPVQHRTTTPGALPRLQHAPSH